MAVQNVTLSIPSELFEQIRERAERGHRSVEDETLELLASAVPESLPKELVDVVKELPFLDDEGLWRAARSHVAAAVAAELESLHFKQQREGLSVAEREAMDGLTQQYERALLVRAQAAAILRARGHDVNGLLVQP